VLQCDADLRHRIEKGFELDAIRDFATRHPRVTAVCIAIVLGMFLRMAVDRSTRPAEGLPVVPQAAEAPIAR
jgi:hypothetical protein